MTNTMRGKKELLYPPTEELLKFMEDLKRDDPQLINKILLGPTVKENVQQAIKVLGNGGLVLYYSELTYGIAVKATDKKAVERLYRVKNRSRDKALTVLAKYNRLKEWAVIDKKFEILPQKFWPGYLSFVLKKKKNREGNYAIPDFVTSNSDSVLIVCMDKVTEVLVEEADFPIANTSANRSGHKPIIDPIEGIKEFKDDVDLFLLGGNCPIGINTTILDISNVRDKPSHAMYYNRAKNLISSFKKVFKQVKLLP
ncbi:MAG: L-threonylcarbamoyladenylate synthase [Nitrospirae bacterium]|nr:L-threonylcarbamoyladenylate synthase [Nitrospirota bacterium]